MDTRQYLYWVINQVEYHLGRENMMDAEKDYMSNMKKENNTYHVLYNDLLVQKNMCYEKYIYV